MNRTLERIGLGSIVVVLALIIVHAPLTVAASTVVGPAGELVKAWKELVILVGLVAVSIDMTRQRKWQLLTRDWLFWTIMAYVVLHGLLAATQYMGAAPTLAGLAIDLRYVAMFALVYMYLRLHPVHQGLMLRVLAIGAAVVVGFACVQLLLPRDFLTIFGYGDDTIQPYMLVDQNQSMPRFSSTLRGPNPLGAYVGIMMAGLVSWLATRRRALSVRDKWVIASGAIASCIALYISHSRSAWIAAVVALAIVLITRYVGRIRAWHWAGLVGLVIIAVIGVAVFRDNPLVSKLVFHEDPAESGLVNSNDEHMASLADGTDRMLSQPLGAGIGSTGSASLLTVKPLIIENQYLFIAHEVGWLGIGLFGVIYGALLHRLWLVRRGWLGLAVFASGVGLSIIGLLLPVWADDTVSIVWWALAAIVIAGIGGARAATHQKTA